MAGFLSRAFSCTVNDIVDRLRPYTNELLLDSEMSDILGETRLQYLAQAERSPWDAMQRLVAAASVG